MWTCREYPRIIGTILEAAYVCRLMELARSLETGVPYRASGRRARIYSYRSFDGISPSFLFLFRGRPGPGTAG